MTVRELINNLKKFDENAEVELQYYNSVSLCQQTIPAFSHRDFYEDEDENGTRTDRIIIDV
ncbi:MAG: hypothetical protein J6T10_03665 [Methanobrevibacter sp.]|nr:hypothetical protein [Methanobrevibacter sp.]